MPAMETPERITAPEYRTRLRQLLGREAPGRALPRKQKDRWILLHAIARRFREDEALREKEATARIQDFLLDEGRRLRTDAVTLRRALIDEGFADRDPAGHDFRASRRHERRVRFEPGCDLPRDPAA